MSNRQLQLTSSGIQCYRFRAAVRVYLSVMVRRILLLPLLLASIFTASIQPGFAADLGIVSVPTGTSLPALKLALLRHAALLLLRKTFEVVPAEQVPGFMNAAAGALLPLGDEAALGQDSEALLAEGSYYIVSLKYLIEFGGANWPTDRAASVYENMALVELASLQDRWIQAVQSGGDVLPILRQVDVINAQTEGQVSVSGDLDHFAAAEALTEAALEGVRDKVGPLPL